MKIKFIAADSAEILLKAKELDNLGLPCEKLSFCTSRGQKLISLLYQVLEDVCGLKRDGHFTTVEYTPYSNGNCRIIFRFTSQPSNRLYIFDDSDSMLDAINKLNCSNYFNTSDVNIMPMGNKFFMYIPCTIQLTKHDLVVLSEYCI